MKFFSRKIDLNVFMYLDLDSEIKKLELKSPEPAVIVLSSVNAIALANKYIVTISAYHTYINEFPEFYISLTTTEPSYKNFELIYEKDILNVDTSMVNSYVLFESEKEAIKYVNDIHNLFNTHFPKDAE